MEQWQENKSSARALKDVEIVKVSELKPGMMLRPKDGYVFRHYPGYASHNALEEHLECVKIDNISSSRQHSIRTAKVAKMPIFYICKRDKEQKEPNTYEYRHEVFVPALGKAMKVASEYWRNIEPME